MDKLKSQGGISPELMEQAKKAMLEENLNYAEAQEPSKRSGAGYPSLGGFYRNPFQSEEMKERTRKGMLAKMRSTETIAYKMAKHHGLT